MGLYSFKGEKGQRRQDKKTLKDASAQPKKVQIIIITKPSRSSKKRKKKSREKAAETINSWETNL